MQVVLWLITAVSQKMRIARNKVGKKPLLTLVNLTLQYLQKTA